MTDNLIKLLDSMTETGVYVITQDTHRILYYNQRVKKVAPIIEMGMVCHELWKGACKNCPLLSIEGKPNSHTINYDDPFGDVVDISADRLLWDDEIPAFLITVSGHKMSADEVRMEREVMQLAKAATLAYSQLLSVNLTQNSFYELGYDAVIDRRVPEGRNFEAWALNCFEQIHPEDREEFRARFSREKLLEAFQREERDISMKYRRKEADGEWHWQSMWVIPVTNSSGKDLLEVTMIRNIDEEMRREEEYKKYLQEQNEGSRKLLQMALEGTSNYEFYYYPPDKRIVNSARLCEKFGSPAIMENVPKCFSETVVSDEYVELVTEAFNDIFAGKKNASCVFRTREDRCCWVRVHLSAISVSEPGTPTYVVGILEDITKEKEHEEKLQSLEQRNQEILLSVNSLYFAIHSINLETDEIRFIKAYEDMEKLGLKSGSSYSDALHRIAEELYEPEDAERFERDYSPERLNSCWSIGQERLSGEYRRRIGKEWRWVSCTVYFMNKEFHQKIVIMALQDIHEQHIRREQEREKELCRERETRQLLMEALNRAEQASRAKSDFLSKMSHDIRTPMNAIVGMTALAENYIDSREKVRECIGKINISSQHMMELINEVLDMSKIESGTLDLTPGEFNLPELIQNTVTMIRPAMEAKEQQLHVNIKNIQHENVVGDRLRLQQVFNNILTNAGKYTPQGGAIWITAEELPAGDGQKGYFRFVFKDNGIGIDEEFLPHLFEPFTRAADSRTSKISGTGLGMAITNNIVQMMDGNIQVESGKDRGSTFTVTVPLAPGRQEAAGLCRLKGKTVLFVDDDEVCRQKAGEILIGMGLRCDLEDSGERAIQRVLQKADRGESYYAVILDWAMPGLDGVETAEAIRSTAGTEETVIVLSAYDWSAVEKEALAAGVDEYLQKPLAQPQLEELFRRLGAEEEKRAARESRSGKEGYEGKRVLLVEDNELNMEIAREMLRIIGIDTEETENGREALERFADVPEGYYDLIFMDIRMPVMDGYEATEKIRKLDRADAKTIPIIAMTADAFSDDVRKALDAGMNEHLSKPIDMESIRKALDRWIRQDR